MSSRQLRKNRKRVQERLDHNRRLMRMLRESRDCMVDMESIHSNQTAPRQEHFDAWDRVRAALAFGPKECLGVEQAIRTYIHLQTERMRQADAMDPIQIAEIYFLITMLDCIQKQDLEPISRMAAMVWERATAISLRWMEDDRMLTEICKAEEAKENLRPEI